MKQELLAVDLEKRDEHWEAQFLGELPKARLRLLTAEPQLGPDGWPYLLGSTDGETTESMTEVIAWLSTRGIGLAINPHKTAPDFVLTYGMVWNFRERGEFLSPSTGHPTGALDVVQGQEVLTGPPSASYFPPYARAIVKRFLMDQGVLAPRVQMVSFDHKNYDLCFSIESLGSPPESEHQGIAEALSWFLPAHYTVCLISEQTIPGFDLL